MIKIDWALLEDLVSALAKKIDNYFPDDQVIKLIGIPRGGCIVAAMLTYWNKRFRLEQYNKLRMLAFPPAELYPAHTVVVDDVLETGKTREAYLEGNGLHLAVLYDKSYAHEGVEHADTSVVNMNVNTWVLFPWEVLEDEQKQDKLNQSDKRKPNIE